jgi:hypothetical protein
MIFSLAKETISIKRMEVVHTRAILGLVIMALFLTGASELQRPPELQGVFQRDGSLWLKSGHKERLLEKQAPTSSPIWSYDGTWLAYALGDGHNQEVRAVHIASGHTVTLRVNGYGLVWAHRSNDLAYQTQDAIYTVALREGVMQGSPSRFAVQSGTFGWLPDDQGFLISSRAYLENGEWQPITLSVLRTDTASAAEPKPIYTLPGMSEDFFAVSLSEFRWSPDGRWVAFLAEPTASWSMDSNTLCLLSPDGTRFLMIGKMPARPDWYAWAPGQNRIGFINGEGRFEVSGKRFEYKDVLRRREPSLTPPGRMDVGFAWVHPNEVIVARAPELTWTEGPVPKSKPALFRIDLASGKSTRVTKPGANEADRNPTYLPPAKRIAWVRTDLSRERSDVWIANVLGGQAAVYIRDVDNAPVWYKPPRQPSVTSAVFTPSYAKWGQLAMRETAKRYHGDIVDYEHLGSREAAPGITEERFRLWLKEEHRQFGVLVSIQFETITDRVVRLELTEQRN